MKKLFIFSLISLLSISCNKKKEQAEKREANSKDSIVEASKAPIQNPSNEIPKNKISDFIPKGYIVYEDELNRNIKGDLNNDGLEDLVILIKGTDKSKIVNDESRGKLDRNRRGIIILFNQGDHYEVASKNYTCFSSENEDGGVYYAPELTVSIIKGKLNINYSQGRYGAWDYLFRYQDGHFALIGYEVSSNRGPTTQFITSVNFLTKKRLTKDNINKDNDDAEEKYIDTWEKLKMDKLLKLSEIKDFDGLYF